MFMQFKNSSGPQPPGKSQVAIICFLRTTGMDPPQEAIGKQLGPLGPIASRRRFIMHSVKYFKKTLSGSLTLMEFSGCVNAVQSWGN